MGCVNPLVELAHQKFLVRFHQSKLEAGTGEAQAGQEYLQLFTERKQQRQNVRPMAVDGSGSSSNNNDGSAGENAKAGSSGNGIGHGDGQSASANTGSHTLKQTETETDGSGEGDTTGADQTHGNNNGGGSGVLPVLPVDALSIAMHKPGLGFSNWWAWCQKCKHGGHADHVAVWFATHEVCPVSDCPCTCCHTT